MLRSLFLTTKPTISLLVVITTLPAILLAAEELPHPFFIFCTLLGAWLASASASSFNQVVEADLDTQMLRTKNRTIPKKDVDSKKVMYFAFALGAAAMLLLWNMATPLAAIIALCGHLFYVLIYTIWLKPRTVQNIVIGGAAGAVGPLIGCAAVNNFLTLEAWLLFLVIFLWTPPHFWALALHYREDYRRAKIPMYPVVYGVDRTKRAILIYSVLLLPLVVVFCSHSSCGKLFVYSGIGLTLWFIKEAWILYQSKDCLQSMRLFHVSCNYALGLFAFLTVDRLVFFFR